MSLRPLFAYLLGWTQVIFQPRDVSFSTIYSALIQHQRWRNRRIPTSLLSGYGRQWIIWPWSTIPILVISCNHYLDGRSRRVVYCSFGEVFAYRITIEVVNLEVREWTFNSRSLLIPLQKPISTVLKWVHWLAWAFSFAQFQFRRCLTLAHCES